MATKTRGGRITGRIALTMEAEVALEVGDAVHGSGDYECVLADGTKPVIGVVSVANKDPRQRGTATRDPIVPGDVTVEACGHFVRDVVASDVIAAGAGVAYAPGGLVAVGAVGAGPQVGIALIGATAAGQKIDVLFT